MCCKKNHKFTEHKYFTEWLLLALGWHQKSQIKLEDSSSLSACHMDYATSIEKQGYQLQGMLLTSSVVGQSEASTRMRFFVRQPSPSGADSVDEGGSDWLDADTLPLNAGLGGLRPNFNPENEGPSVPEVYLTTTANVPVDVPSASPHWDTVTYTHTVGSLPLRLSPHYPPIYSLETTSTPSTTSTLGPATASGSANGRTSNGPSSKTKTAIAIPVSIAGAAMIATVMALFLVLRQRRRQRLFCVSKTTQNNGDEATPPPQRPQNSQTTLPETSNTPNMSAIQIPRKPLLPAWKNQSPNNSNSEETNPGYLPHESSSVLIPSGSFDFEFGDAPTSLNSKSINNALGWNASTDEFLRSEFNGSSRDDASVVSEVVARAGGGHDQGSSSHLDDVSFVSEFSGQDAGSTTTTTTTTTTHAVTDR